MSQSVAVQRSQPPQTMLSLNGFFFAPPKTFGVKRIKVLEVQKEKFSMRFFSVCLIAMLCCGRWPARADDTASVSAADHQAIEQVITSQIDAFRRDAGDAAFSFASPHIQSMFGDAPHFMAMVRQGYPAVYRPRSVTFQQLTMVKERIVQRVMIIGPDGAAALVFYTMERELDGNWRIDGCVLTQPDGLNT